jgi:hypothetical protein
MRQEFMKAAKRIGSFLTAGVLALGVAFSAQAQDELPFPSFPSSFAEASYQGQQGCIPNDDKFLFAVSKNEGLDYIGIHPQIETPKDGMFIMEVVHSKDKGYGYILENRGHGSICVNQPVADLKTHNELNLMPAHHRGALKAEDCTFEPQVLNLCGTFEQVSARLINAGYSQDWQAKNSDGNTITMLSGTGQSWILTTNAETGATIFTGAGKGEFTAPVNQNTTTPPNLVAKN